MTATSESSTVPNAKRLLWAGFMAILAAGVGFSIRAGILGQWAEQYGFTQTELGAITGGGLTGFGIIILLSSLLADKVGFGKLMAAAFAMHIVSALLTLLTGAAYAAGLAVGFWSSTDEVRKQWQQSRRWNSTSTAEQRATGYAGWKKAVERTLNWVD